MIQPHPTFQFRPGFAPASSPTPPGGLARSRRRFCVGAALLWSLGGCVTPTMTVVVPSLTAAPNPSTDGAYTVSWTPVRGASSYRLHEDGALRYEGPGHRHAVENQAEGSYTYSLTYCVTAFGIEACNFRPPVADVTVTVTRR